MSYKNLQQARSEILVDHPKSKLIKNKLDRHVASRTVNHENENIPVNGGGGTEGNLKQGARQRSPRLKGNQTSDSAHAHEAEKSSPTSSGMMTTASSGGSNIGQLGTITAGGNTGGRMVYTANRAERMGKTKQTKSSNQLASNSPHIGPIGKFRPQETYNRRPMQSRRVSRAQAKRNQTAYSSEFNFDGLSASPRNLARANPNAGCDIPVTITNKNSIRHTNLSELGSRQGPRSRKVDPAAAGATSTIHSNMETEEGESNWWLKNFVTSNGFYSKEQRMRDTMAAAATTMKGQSPIVPSKYYNLSNSKAGKLTSMDETEYDSFKYENSAARHSLRDGSDRKAAAGRKTKFLPTLRHSGTKSRKEETSTSSSSTGYHHHNHHSSAYPKHGGQSRNSSMPVRNSYDTKPTRFGGVGSKGRSFVKKPSTPVPVYNSKSTLGGGQLTRRKGAAATNSKTNKKSNTMNSAQFSRFQRSHHQESEDDIKATLGGGNGEAVQSMVHTTTTTLHEYYNVSLSQQQRMADNSNQRHQGDVDPEDQGQVNGYSKHQKHSNGNAGVRERRFKRDRFIKSDDGIIEEATPPDTPSQNIEISKETVEVSSSL